MAVTANTEKVEVKVGLTFDKQSGDKAAKQIKDFETKQAQKSTAHKKTLEQIEERHQQKLRQMQETALKKAELRMATSQKKIADGTKSWSQRMTDSTERITTSIKGLTLAFISTQLIQGIKNLAVDAIAFAGDMQTLSDATGLTVEALTGLQFAGTLVGVKFGAMEKSFDTITNKLQEARAGSESAQRAFSDLGVDFRSAGLEDVVKQLLEASQNTENFSKVVDVLGQKGASAYKKLATVGDITAIMNEARDAGALMTSETASKLDALGDKWDALKMKMRIAIAGSIQQSMPVIDDFIDKFAVELSKIDFKPIVEGLLGLTLALQKILSIFVALAAPITAIKGLAALLSSSGLLAFAGKMASGKQAADMARVSSEIAKASAALSAAVAAGKDAAYIKVFSDALITLRAEMVAIVSTMGPFQKFFKGLFLTLKGFGPIAHAISRVTSALSGLFKVIGPVFRFLGRWSGYLTAFFAIWDFSKARAAGLTLLESLAYTTLSFLQSLTFGLGKFADRYLEARRKTGADKTPMKAVSLSDFGPQTQMSDVEAAGRALVGRVTRTAQTVTTPKELEEWQKSVDQLYKEALANMKQEAILKDKLLDVEVMLYQAKEKNLKLKSPGSLAGFLAPEPLVSKGLSPADNLMGDAIMQLRGNKGEAALAAQALKNLGDSGAYTKKEMAELANILGLPAMRTFADNVAVASQATYNIGAAMQSLMQIQQNFRDKDVEEHERKMARLNSELDALREQGLQYTEFYRNKEKLANQENKDHVKTMQRMFKFQRAVNTITAIMDSYLGFNAVLKDPTLPSLAKLVLAPTMLAMGMANAAAIASQPTPKFKSGGVIPGNQYQDSTMVLAQGGEFISNRYATRRNRRTLESINNGVNMDGGPSINVNISGNVIGQREWVRDHLVPELKRAVKDGYSA